MKTKTQRPASDLVNKRTGTASRAKRSKQSKDAAGGETICRYLEEGRRAKRAKWTRKAEKDGVAKSSRSRRASLLQLDDNSLSAILSCLDCRSLFNASLTCKRLQVITQRNQSWSLDVLRARAKCCVYQ